MTTAHRPTWAPAKGGGTARDQGRTQQFSSRDLPGHTTLKLREPAEDVEARDLKAELRRKEEELRNKKRRYAEPEEEEEVDNKAPRLLDAETAALDADDPEEGGDDDDDSSDSDEDDTAELLAELERIKKERAQEQARKAAEALEEQEQIRTENLLQGNPLLQHGAGDFTIKKRWDDDVVFKNCARGVPDKKTANYVNDTIRSDFHRKFMKKYVQ